MIWTAWRQHRAQLVVLAALLLVVGGAVLLLHSSMSQDIRAHGLQGCVAADGAGTDCLRSRMDFQGRWFDLLKAGQAGIVALPVLLGVFAAAPLFAREIEHGTHVLAFTQSVSRFRWMAIKTGTLLLPSLVVLVVLQLLVGRWVAAAGRLGPLRTGPFDFTTFDSTGPMPVAQLLFAFGVGALLGATTGRSLRAMTATLGALVVLRTLVTNVHLSFLPAQRRISRWVGESPDDLRGEIVDSGLLGPGGHPLPGGSVDLSSCHGFGARVPELPACYAQQGVTGSYVDLIPASAAPMLQSAEFAAFGIAAALLLAGTAWTLQHQR